MIETLKGVKERSMYRFFHHTTSKFGKLELSPLTEVVLVDGISC